MRRGEFGLTSKKFQLSNTINSSRPKACFIYYMKYEGSALLYREAKALMAKGYDVDIVCLRRYPKDPIIQELDGLRLFCIQSRPNSESNSMVYFLRLILFFLKATAFLTLIAPFKHYRIVHVTSPPDIMVFSAIAPKILGSKIILDIHDIGPELYMRKLHVGEEQLTIKFIKMMERISARFADHVITVTDMWRNKLIHRSVCPAKCSVMLNVPDHNIFKPCQKASETSEYFNLFYHGSLEEHFGVDIMLRAAPLIKKSIPNMFLNIYGAGRLRDEFISFVNRTQMSDYVIFHDAVPFLKLPQILAYAHVGIVPTKDEVFSDDAVSMKSLEYISLDIPIVISKTKAHSFYFDDSMVRFFEPGNEHELALAVIDLFKNPSQRESMVQHARAFMERNGWSQVKEHYFGIIDSLLLNVRA